MITTVQQKDRLLARLKLLEQKLDAESLGQSEALAAEQRDQVLLEMAEIQEQIVSYEADCARDQLKVPSEGLVLTPAHVRAGLAWFFGRFSSDTEMSREEAVTLLNVSVEDIVQFQHQLQADDPIRVPYEVIVRLSLLLGIYGALARIAPNGPSRFMFVAFREARNLFYNEHTLMEFLLSASSLDRWYAVRAHLRSLEAGFIG